MESKTVLREILLILDQETHNHLRDTDLKRDHLFELYLKVILTFFSGFAGLEFLKVSWNLSLLFLVTIISSIIIIFGELVYFSMIASRKWHAEYINIHLLIQAALVKETTNFDPNLVPPENRQPFAPSLYTNRSFLLVQISNMSVIIVIAVLWYQFIENLILFVVAGILMVALFGLNMLRGKIILKKSEQIFWANPSKSWLLAGLSTVNDSKKGGPNCV